MKICRNCHLEYEDKFIFCKKCGQKLEINMKQNTQSSPMLNFDVEMKNKGTNISDYKKWTTTVGSIVFLVLMGFFVISGSFVKDNNIAGNLEVKEIENIPQKNVEVQKKERIVPKSFKSFNFSPDVIPRNIYLPNKFKRIREEEKVFNTSSYKHIKAGISLYGLVDYNGAGENDKLKRYEIIVIYSKSPNFEKLSRSVEEKSFEEGLKGTLISVQTTGDVSLISKDICENVDGHRYLDAVYSVSEKGNFNNKTTVRYVLSFFDGKMYGVFMKTFSDAYLKYNKEFDIIAKTFGTYQEL